MTQKDLSELRRRQGPVVVDEADPRIQLRIAGKALFDARHTNDHQAELAAIKKIAQLFEARRFQSVGFVDDQQLERMQEWLQSGGILNVIDLAFRVAPWSDR